MAWMSSFGKYGIAPETTSFAAVNALSIVLAEKFKVEVAGQGTRFLSKPLQFQKEFFLG
jgi:hypothetical protein